MHEKPLSMNLQQVTHARPRNYLFNIVEIIMVAHLLTQTSHAASSKQISISENLATASFEHRVTISLGKTKTASLCLDFLLFSTTTKKE